MIAVKSVVINLFNMLSLFFSSTASYAAAGKIKIDDLVEDVEL